jgi:hypothetical protein
MPRTVIPVTTIEQGRCRTPAQTSSDQSNGMYVAKNNGRVIFEIISTDGSANGRVRGFPQRTVRRSRTGQSRCPPVGQRSVGRTRRPTTTRRTGR